MLLTQVQTCQGPSSLRLRGMVKAQKAWPSSGDQVLIETVCAENIHHSFLPPGCLRPEDWMLTEHAPTKVS